MFNMKIVVDRRIERLYEDYIKDIFSIHVNVIPVDRL